MPRTSRHRDGHVDPLVAQLARRRKQLGLSARTVVRRMGYSSPTTISNLELGRRTTTLPVLRAFADALGCRLVLDSPDTYGQHGDPDPLVAQLARRRERLRLRPDQVERALGITHSHGRQIRAYETGAMVPGLALLTLWVSVLGGVLTITWLDEDSTAEDDPDLPAELLTPEARRHRILTSIAAGRAPSEIARAAGVSQRTVHRWKSSLKRDAEEVHSG